MSAPALLLIWELVLLTSLKYGPFETNKLTFKPFFWATLMLVCQLIYGLVLNIYGKEYEYI